MRWAGSHQSITNISYIATVDEPTDNDRMFFAMIRARYSHWIKSSTNRSRWVSVFSLSLTYDTFQNEFVRLAVCIFFAPLLLLICCRQRCPYQILWHSVSPLRFILRRSMFIGAVILCMISTISYHWYWTLSNHCRNKNSVITFHWYRLNDRRALSFEQSQPCLRQVDTTFCLKIPSSFWICSRFFVFVIFFRNHSKQHAAEALIIANNGFYRCVHCMHIKSIQ